MLATMDARGPNKRWPRNRCFGSPASPPFQLSLIVIAQVPSNFSMFECSCVTRRRAVRLHRRASAKRWRYWRSGS